MRSLLASSLWAFCAPILAAPGAAGELPVVVELFTAQGCSACPPADAMMEDLAAMEGVIALSLHVDYWDYIGWTDSFASPAFTARQEAYARAAHERMVYTPQIVMNGQDRLLGGDAMAVMERLHAHAAGATPVTLRLTRQGDGLRIEAEAAGPVPAMTVELVRYEVRGSVEITAGENAGMTIDYTNVVTAWSSVGTWSGEGRFTLDVPAPGTQPAVVLLQAAGPGRIMAAAVDR